MGRGAGDPRKACDCAPRRSDRNRQWHRVTRNRQTGNRTSEAAAGSKNDQDCRLRSRRVRLFGLRLCLGGIAGARRYPTRSRVDCAAPAGSARRAREDRSQGDRRRPISARPRRKPFGALARCRGRRLRQRGWRRRQYGVCPAIGARVGHWSGPRAGHRAASRR